jgi:hypothetical protein
MTKSKSKKEVRICVPCGNNQVAEFELIKSGVLASEDADDETAITKAVLRLWEWNCSTGELPGWTSLEWYGRELPFKVIEGGCGPDAGEDIC